MLIDCFTVIAQVVNFLVLVWLLRRFLYSPILQAIDAREKGIAAKLADAESKMAEAQKERDEFKHKNDDIDAQRITLLTKATDDAKAERQRLMDQARKSADELTAKRQETLANEAQSLNLAIGRRAQTEVFAIVRKTLADLSSSSLEQHIAEVFTNRLRQMDAASKTTLSEAIKTSSQPAVVRTALELPAEQQSAVRNTVNETFSADVPLRFEVSPDLIGGIELTANGQKLAWSIENYLTSLEKGVVELTAANTKTLVQPDQKAEPALAAKAA